MSTQNNVTIAGAFIVIWAVLGFLDVGNFSTTGYGTNFENSVTSVQAGSPAEVAGMQVDDVLQSIDGIDIDDTSALNARPRATIGQTHTIVVDRGGETVELSLTRGAQSASQRINSYIGILIGLAFGLLGVWAYRTVGTRAGFLLAMAGILFAVTFTGGPYLGNGIVANIVGMISALCLVLAFAKLLHFSIVFPNRSEPDKKKVYGPALLVGLLLVSLNIFQPTTGGTLNTVFQFVFFAWLVGYIGLTLLTMFRTWSAGSPVDREAHGLTMMLGGTGLGLGLLLIAAVVGLLFPNVTIPGAQWFVTALILVPISCSLAVVKSGRASI